MAGANLGTSQTTPPARNAQSGRTAQAKIWRSALFVRQGRSEQCEERTEAQAAKSAPQERSAKQTGRAPPARVLRAQTARSAQPWARRLRATARRAIQAPQATSLHRRATRVHLAHFRMQEGSRCATFVLWAPSLANQAKRRAPPAVRERSVTAQEPGAARRAQQDSFSLRMVGALAPHATRRCSSYRALSMQSLQRSAQRCAARSPRQLH